jgi:hypothetical protein
MTKVIRLRNPAAFEQQDINVLFDRAFKDTSNINYPAFWKLMPLLAQDEKCGIFVGVEKGKFEGLVIGELPSNEVLPLPTVIQFANFGSAKCRNGLVDAVVDFFVSAGYTEFLALNVTKEPDEAWSRLFRKAGEAERVASLMKFKIG